jgi:exonuclease SbcD
MKNTNCKHIVITGGNHDAPGTINAPKELLNALSIKVVGKATEDVKDEIFELKTEKEKLIVCAVPYLRDQDIRKAVVGESFKDISEKYKHALVNHYNEIYNRSKKINNSNIPTIAMGHLFAMGGSPSESEQQIYVGGLGDISADDFPNFNYIALGHLHRPQKVGNKNHIRYSGSPIILSFSEINYDKKVIVIETKDDNSIDVSEITVPKFREFFRVTGDIDTCIAELQIIDKKQLNPTPWIEVVLDNQNGMITGANDINKAVENLNLKVLKITLKDDIEYEGIKSLAEKHRNIKELSPLDVFKRKCEENKFDLSENQDILDAFNEILQIAKKH